MALKITLWQDVEDESDCEEEKEDTGEEQSENGNCEQQSVFTECCT
jgi:hypothetical protein